MATKKTKREPTARVTHPGRGVIGALREILAEPVQEAGVCERCGCGITDGILCDHCEMMENMYDV